MSRRIAIALLGAAVLAPSVAAPAAATSGQNTPTESGNPINDQGSSYHYRTYVTAITPSASGLSVEVLEFADRLLLRNHTGQTVTVYGYSGEPYARVQADGTTEQNVLSPAVYLNTNFYANVTVPPSASASAPPKWTVVDRTGQLEWHDHRIHWMSPVKPPQVTNEGKRTKIFNWSVPIEIGAHQGAIDGELFWVPQSSKAPAGALVALVAIVLLGAALVFAMRRRRTRPSSSGTGPGNAADHAAGPPSDKEAW
jgi:hypothetical protein